MSSEDLVVDAIGICVVLVMMHSTTVRNRIASTWS